MTALSPDLDFSATARMVRYQDRGLEPAMADMGAERTLGSFLLSPPIRSTRSATMSVAFGACPHAGRTTGKGAR
ncbi:hypothetical protein SAMN02746095_00596 [Acidocella aminolytica 101 = DSM 11237]|uniref:Uncharacterized protein n=1 Tax=Acidocella aminolytica 101 = DSM 11237 TaxID=1120923 RepID=A0A0D6PF73_9PROT|nr:hypothetical protein Aam_021_097 [Acidocella aminolytica 101 = DSM 11237]GBQ44284.1 hypothetical protein AA11237_3497 [Acidocella aminolytica 101 = DSM 11237]SHE47581.1 hypothetical protein SAMN02746095_00596 [Acidocella aminolytica 101 = DSM 11237]